MRAAMKSMLMPAFALAAILVGGLDCPVNGQVSVATSKNTKPLAPRKAPPAEHAGGRGADLGPTPQATIEMVGRAREVPSSAVASRRSIACGRGSKRPYATKHNPACGPDASTFARTSACHGVRCRDAIVSLLRRWSVPRGDHAHRGGAEHRCSEKRGEILVTANAIAALSNDRGIHWSVIDPGTKFQPQPAGQEFLCDQVVLYDSDRDLMVWYLQHKMLEGVGNFYRLAVASGDDISNQNFLTTTSRRRTSTRTGRTRCSTSPTS